MRPRSLLAHLLLVLSLSMGVSAQMQMAQCLLEWEWVCHLFPLVSCAFLA